MFKKQIIIFVALFIIFLVVSGCQKQSKNNQAVINNQEQQESGKDLKNQEIEIEPEKNEWQGELISEKDGWKRYRNEYYGVEFRFRDNANSIKIYSNREGIILSGPASEEQIKFSPYTDENTIITYATINTYGFSIIDDVEHNDLEDYLNAGWNIYEESAELELIKELVNTNGTKYYEVIVKIDGGRQSPGITYTSIMYYFDYNLTGDKDYVIIHCSKFEVCSEIVESFIIKG